MFLATNQAPLWVYVTFIDAKSMNWSKLSKFSKITMSPFLIKCVGRFQKSEYRNRPLTTLNHHLYSEFSNQRNENNVYDPDFCALSNHTNKNTNRGLIVETLLRYWKQWSSEIQQCQNVSSKFDAFGTVLGLPNYVFCELQQFRTACFLVIRLGKVRNFTSNFAILNNFWNMKYAWYMIILHIFISKTSVKFEFYDQKTVS